jgi:uracil-DNA glycosylase family 4
MKLADLANSSQPVYPTDIRVKVTGEGPTNAHILILGEAPGRQELKEGLPIVGQSGRILNTLLDQAGLKRSDVRIENVFERYVSKRKDARGKQVYYIGKERVFHPDKGFLDECLLKDCQDRIKALKPNVIVPMGECALQAISDKKGIGKWKCSILWSDLFGVKYIPTYHPAAALWGSATNKLYIKIAIDRAAANYKFSELRNPRPILSIRPSLDELREYVQIIRETKICGFDIEVLRNRLSHISLSHSKESAISIPFLWENINFYTDLEETQIILEVIKILEDSNILKIGQNLNFDNTFMLEHYGCVVTNFVDTMVAQKTVFPELEMGLDNVTRMHTLHPFYKEDGQWSKKGLPRDFIEFGKYSARDALICVEAWPVLEENLRFTKNIKTFENQNSLIPIITYMGMKGLRTDLEVLDKLSEAADKELEKFENQIKDIVGYEINPNSSDQLKELFYGAKEDGNFGLRPYLSKGKPTTDKDALKKLGMKKGKPGKVAKIVRKHRKLAKLNGTYYKVDLKKVGESHRFLSSYGPVTKLGRLSGKKRLDGFGGNPQNVPKAVNIAFLADPGHLIFNVDLSQADARSVALVGNVKRMLDAFESGKDLHSITGEFLFGIPADDIRAMDKEGKKSHIGDGTKTHRDWAKRCGHSLNFDLGAKSFAAQYELPIKEANLLVNKYHNEAYPEIRDGYHKAILDMLEHERCTYNSFGRRMYFFEEGDDLRKVAYSSIAQSNTVDIINQWGLIPFFYEDRFKHVDVIRQVHDSINFQIPIFLGVDGIYDLLLEMRSSLERKLWWEDRYVIIPSDWSVGLSLGSQTDLDLNNELATKEWLNSYIKDSVTQDIDYSKAFEEDLENFKMES